MYGSLIVRDCHGLVSRLQATLSGSACAVRFPSQLQHLLHNICLIVCVSLHLALASSVLHVVVIQVSQLCQSLLPCNRLATTVY